MAVEFEFQKYIYKEDHPQHQELLFSLGFKESSLDKEYFQYMTIYTVSFLYTLFLLPKQITHIDDNTLNLL